MSKTLYLPEHLAQKMNKEKPDTSDSSVVDGAYVDAKDRVLDPGLLDKPLLDRLPQPTGWRLLVMPYQGASKTTGGLHIPDEVRDREAVATVVAYVLKLGPLAYKDPSKFGDLGSGYSRRRWLALVQGGRLGLYRSVFWL